MQSNTAAHRSGSGQTLQPPTFNTSSKNVPSMFASQKPKDAKDAKMKDN